MTSKHPLKSIVCGALVALASAVSLDAAVSLPKLFSDNMVLQRDKPVAVWGSADPGETVTVTFQDQAVEATADANGDWKATLAPAAFGGPFELEVKGDSSKRVFKNVLVGDVWVCSGQSNMEFPLRNADNAERAIPTANFPQIRLFTVEKSMSFAPQKDVAGGQWDVCSPDSVADFSAVGFFFGRDLYRNLNIPIGLIHTSWGGTDIQTWTSFDVMSQSGEYSDIDPEKLEADIAASNAKRPLYLDAVENDKGLAEKWYLPDTDLSDWKPIDVPAEWAGTVIGDVDGVAWFRTEFDLPKELADKPATLSLGPIDDEDATYLNGELIGKETEWNKDRLYPVAPGLTKAGRNILVVKVQDNQGGGGLYGKPWQLYIEVDGRKIPLNKKWLYRSSALTSDFGIVNMNPNSYPSLLYNAMVNPLINYSVKGVTWYQGENNAWQASRYRDLFTQLIRNWRSKWQDELPFYWVQLANYKAAPEQPVDSDWAELREAQDMALKLPKTGQAVIIDIGNANDIHPRDKVDVGHRLALAALHTTYGQDIVYSGPRFASMKVRHGVAVLSFDNVGNGLVAAGEPRYNYLKGFAVADKDRKWHWAKAYIDGDKVIVFSESVRKPVAVRYAWADNPADANLYNKEGLPAAPFRTDDWPGITEGK